MNTMKVSEFSPWWIRNLLDRIRNRKRDIRYGHDEIFNTVCMYTWIKCCNRAINKMRYRFNDHLNSAKNNRDWDALIAYQIIKLHKRYDPVYLWGITEYANCEKVNFNDFPRDIFPCLVWKFKAIEQAVDIAKRMPHRYKIGRGTNYDWGHLITNTRRKFKHSKNVETILDDEYWLLVYRSNHDKLNKMCGYISWSSCIHQNQRKVNRWPK